MRRCLRHDMFSRFELVERLCRAFCQRRKWSAFADERVNMSDRVSWSEPRCCVLCMCRIYAEEEVYLEHDRSPAPAARLMSDGVSSISANRGHEFLFFPVCFLCFPSIPSSPYLFHSHLLSRFTYKGKGKERKSIYIAPFLHQRTHKALRGWVSE